MRALAAACHGVGEAETTTALDAAIKNSPDLLPLMIVALSSAEDEHDSSTWEFRRTVRRFSNRLPAVVPIDALGMSIRERWPDLPTVRSGFSDGIENDVERLAAEFIAVHQPEN